MANEKPMDPEEERLGNKDEIRRHARETATALSSILQVYAQAVDGPADKREAVHGKVLAVMNLFARAQTALQVLDPPSRS